MLVSDGSDGEDEKGNEIKNKNKRNAFQVKCGYTALPMELIKVERINDYISKNAKNKHHGKILLFF